MSCVLFWLHPWSAPSGGPQGLGIGDVNGGLWPLYRVMRLPPPAAVKPLRTRSAGSQPPPTPPAPRHPRPRPASRPRAAPAPRGPSLPRDGNTGAGCWGSESSGAVSRWTDRGERAASRARSPRGRGAGEPGSRGAPHPGRLLFARPPSDRGGMEVLLRAPGQARRRGRGRPPGAPRRGLSPPWSPAWLCCWVLAGCQAAWAGDLPSSSRPLPPCQEVSCTWSFTWS